MSRRNAKPSRGQELLTAWATEHHVSYTRLAADLGVTANAAYAWFIGRCRPGVDLWFAIETVTHGRVPSLSWTMPPQDRAAKADGE